MTNLTHKIRIYPNKEQEELLQKSCDVARYVYNWGLAKWNEEYEEGNKPNFYQIKKEFNSLKKEECPFVMEVSKCASEYALMDLKNGFTKFFRKQAKHPQFHKKERDNTFSLSNDQFQIIDKQYIKIPKSKKYIKLSEKLRFEGKIMKATISKKCDKWFVSISVETNIEKLLLTDKEIGIDLGVKEIATCSNGLIFDNPEWIKKIERKIKRKQRQIYKQKRGSNRRNKNKLRLQKLNYKLTNQRNDYLHKLTIYIIRTNDIICLEDLNVRGMVKNHNLAKAISNVSLYELRRQFEYKAKLYGKEIKYVDKWFPSSKTCSKCGYIKKDLTLKDRIYKCPNCGLEIDRDFNASLNILRQAMSEVKHEENRKQIDLNGLTFLKISSINQLDSMNRESKLNTIK